MTVWNVLPQPRPKPSPTFQSVVDKARAGDMIHVAAGDYPEAIRVTKALTIICDSGATVRSFQWSGVTGGDLSGLTVVGPKVPLPNPIELTHPDLPGAVPISGQLEKAARLELARAKWSKVMKTIDAFSSPFTIGIKVSNCVGTKVTSCTASRHTAGISVENSSDVQVTDCHATLCSTGIRTSGGSKIVISKCGGSQNLGTAFALFGTNDSAIVGCEAEHCGIGCYAVHNASARNLVSKSRGRASGWFAETMDLPGPSCFNVYAGGPGNVFEACWAEGQKDATGNDGGGFIADTSGPNGIVVRTCTAIDNAGSGVQLTKTDGNSVIGNKLVGNKKPVGVWMSTGNTISNNG